MSYINPILLSKLDELQPELKTEILSRNVPLNSLSDLIAVMEQIIAEEEAKQ